MKKSFFTLFLMSFLFMSINLDAQIQTPAASPSAKLEQTVGLTDITIDYSRPAKKGRELFVDVEKWGKMWRTGANQSTKITFSEDVMVEGNKVPKGTYAIYSIPDQKMWTVMLYKDLGLGGNTGAYKEADELCRFKVETVELPVEMENFGFLIDNIKDGSASIAFMWGKYFVSFKVETEVESVVMASIEKTMAGPTRNDYYQAAHYYLNTDKDINQALAWAKKAYEMEAKYWQLRLEAQIYAKMGDSKRAVAKIAESSAAAKEAGNSDYAEANDKMAAEWKNM